MAPAPLELFPPFVADDDKPMEVETSFIDPAPVSSETVADGCNHSEEAIPRSDVGSENIGNGESRPEDSASRNSLERAPKTDPLLFRTIAVEEGSCYSDSENDLPRPDSKRQSYDSSRFKSSSSLMKLPMFLKRRRKKKRRGNTWNDHKPTKVRCDCAVSGEELCLVHMKSHSESDINGATCRIGEDYLADLSDISVTSFSLAEDDTSSGSYVDIDLCNLRRFLHDSGSWSQSERSFELSSDWSELHRTISEPSINEECYSMAEECRESDIPDTASDFSQDSRTHTKRHRLLHHHRRLKRLPMTGHHVNESFLENECFCCHCIVM